MIIVSLTYISQFFLLIRKFAYLPVFLHQLNSSDMFLSPFNIRSDSKHDSLRVYGIDINHEAYFGHLIDKPLRDEICDRYCRSPSSDDSAPEPGSNLEHSDASTFIFANIPRQSPEHSPPPSTSRPTTMSKRRRYKDDDDERSYGEVNSDSSHGRRRQNNSARRSPGRHSRQRQYQRRENEVNSFSFDNTVSQKMFFSNLSTATTMTDTPPRVEIRIAGHPKRTPHITAAGTMNGIATAITAPMKIDPATSNDLGIYLGSHIDKTITTPAR